MLSPIHSTDNGPCYRARLFARLCCELGLKHRRTWRWQTQQTAAAKVADKKQIPPLRCGMTMGEGCE